MDRLCQEPAEFAACITGVRFVLLGLLLTACTAANPAPAPTSPPEPEPEPRPSYTGQPGTPSEPLEPLHGVLLAGETGLRLLIGGTVYDVDRGTRQRVAGLPVAVRDEDIAIDAVGRDVVLSLWKPRQEVYILRHGATTAERIATGVRVTPGLDGLWAVTDAPECGIAKISLAGDVLIPAKPLDCSVQPRLETKEGLHVWLDAAALGGGLLDPRTLRTLSTADDTIAAVGGRTLRWDGDSALLLGDRRFPVPSSISYGRPQVTVSPNQRYATVEYGHPAWPGPRQRLDVWVLALSTGRWTHLPSMPVGLALKMSDVTWTNDGRLVLLGSFDGTGRTLAVWRPGEEQLAIRPFEVTGAQVIVL